MNACESQSETRWAGALPAVGTDFFFGFVQFLVLVSCYSCPPPQLSEIE